MAHREGSKSKTIEQLSEIVAGAIMEMNDGDEASIAKLVAE